MNPKTSSFTSGLGFLGALCIATTPCLLSKDLPSPVPPEHEAEPDLSSGPQAEIEGSTEEHLARGRDLITRLNLDLSDLDSLEAAVGFELSLAFQII